ncbi:hypothetical protein [Rubrolithibacter danxiaensis]|uniref:hypothetical protein n=1 Tax=Rubrolithibacter danxiaensis TaxID=3390805 RepID=UPI003BF7F4B5
MKKLVLLLITGLSLLVSPSIALNNPVKSELSVKKDVTVYVTKTGSKYHRDGCRYLSKSKISISKKEAIKDGYEPCKVCKP